MVEGQVARCSGVWALATLHELEKELHRGGWPKGEVVQLDLSGLLSLDTAGAWLIHRTVSQMRSQGLTVTLQGASAQAEALLGLMSKVSLAEPVAHLPVRRGGLEALGQRVLGSLELYVDFLAFVGESAVGLVRHLRRPHHIRWRMIVIEVGAAGAQALPIVGLLSFLLGVVIAYQAGVVLRTYGASLFVADVAALSMLRELAPLITAIIVAGRTGSAYAAQLGTMKVTQQVDALRSMGVSILDYLVLPKFFALTVALPLLTVYADVVGLTGGMLMAKAYLGVSVSAFAHRLNQSITSQAYSTGLAKAPIFAGIVAAVGTFQGLRVSASAESVGRQTTISVVQSIFLVILVDALFSVIYGFLGV